jgi:alpha-L-fucosidase 2
MVLWYEKPAANWNEALPVGNGRLGAMVFGGAEAERLQLNEDSIWSGEPHYNPTPRMRESIPVVQKLLFDGKYAEALQDLWHSRPRLCTPGAGVPPANPPSPAQA